MYRNGQVISPEKMGYSQPWTGDYTPFETRKPFPRTQGEKLSREPLDIKTALWALNP